jgi:hypothetical protein
MPPPWPTGLGHARRVVPMLWRRPNLAPTRLRTRLKKLSTLPSHSPPSFSVSRFLCSPCPWAEQAPVVEHPAASLTHLWAWSCDEPSSSPSLRTLPPPHALSRSHLHRRRATTGPTVHGQAITDRHWPNCAPLRTHVGPLALHRHFTAARMSSRAAQAWLWWPNYCMLEL